MTDVPAGAAPQAGPNPAGLPASKLGWAAVVLAACGFAAAAFGFTVGAVLKAGGPWTINPMLFMLSLGMAGGVCAIVALVKGDRSWAVWVALVPGAFTLVLLIGEFASAALGIAH